MPGPTFLGVSLKMYLGYQHTLRWAEQVAAIAGAHPAVQDGLTDLVVLPSFPALPAVYGVVAGTGVQVGAQNLSSYDQGALTGEVGAPMLAEIGCRYAEVGHAERRGLFGETDAVVAEKTLAALRNGLTPVLCVGEPARTTPTDAARTCIRQTAAAVVLAAAQSVPAPLVVAYEPHWAIGAAQPAPTEYIQQVCREVGNWLAQQSAMNGSRIIYGGSAGPGLLTRLGDAVDGLFLGRFAHNPAAIASILDEAAVFARPNHLQPDHTQPGHPVGATR